MTVNRLGVTGALLRTLESTNPVESMIEIVRDHARRVKHWTSGEMARCAGPQRACTPPRASSAASRACGNCPNSPAPWSGRSATSPTSTTSLHVMWLFGASTGVRRSELLGVRWADIDLDAATVTIRQTVTETEEGYEPEEDQKSRLSARTIHLDARVVAELRRQRARQSEARIILGEAWQDHDLVFCQADGSWWNPPAVTHAFRRAVKRAGVPVIRLQDLRHTHATLLLVAGVNPKVVSERLGHSSVAFALDTYAHVMPGMQPEALFMDLVLAAPLEPGADADDDEDDDEDDGTAETEVGQ